jgi:polyphosphate kinase 2 (PPK2 family)
MSMMLLRCGGIPQTTVRARGRISQVRTSNIHTAKHDTATTSIDYKKRNSVCVLVLDGELALGEMSQVLELTQRLGVLLVRLQRLSQPTRRDKTDQLAILTTLSLPRRTE